MSVGRVRRFLTALTASAVAVLGLSVASAAPAAAEDINIRNVCYNASQAGPFANHAHQAASIWNAYTNNINMAQCGSNIMIYYTYGGGSYAVTYSLGNGYVVIDYYQAQQYSALRIMTHELGHILGLPDNYNGQCHLLMSGGSAGTGCTNPYPYYTESQQVDSYFRSGFAGAEKAETKVFKDSWPAPVTVG